MSTKFTWELKWNLTLGVLLQADHLPGHMLLQLGAHGHDSKCQGTGGLGPPRTVAPKEFSLVLYIHLRLKKIRKHMIVF